jgi:hypothetical protein
VLAHLVTDSSVLWYPLVALGAPALIVAALTRLDRARHHRAGGGPPASAGQEVEAQPEPHGEGGGSAQARAL